MSIFSRAAIVAAVVLFAAAFGSGIVVAQNAHFVGKVKNLGISDTSDTVTGKIAGLGDNENVDITATADAAALFACRNNGGNFPTDPKKQQETQQLSTTITASPDNGQVTFSIVLGPVTTTLECPGNQVVALACIEFANKEVSFLTTAGQSGGPQDANPSSVSAIFFNKFRSDCQALFASNP